ncbi:MAG: DUF167 domain-containing protein [Candidatus Micrarchaeota archaeon]
MALKIRVIPNASKFSVILKETGFVVKTKSPAINNKANKEVTRELTRLTGKKVFISSGLKNREKQIIADGLSDEKLAALMRGWQS